MAKAFTAQQAVPGVAALVLAAGAGTRFGADKRRVRLAGGETLLAQTCGRALAAGLPVYVALRAGEELPLPSGVEPLPVTGAEQGMGATLAAAISALATLPAASRGCLVLLGDMPWIEVTTLRRLAQALGEAGAAGLVAPYRHGRRGHPVGFGRDWFTELQCLRGDRGARGILERETGRVHRVVVDDPGIEADVDTVADLIAGPPGVG